MKKTFFIKIWICEQASNTLHHITNHETYKGKSAMARLQASLMGFVGRQLAPGIYSSKALDFTKLRMGLLLNGT